MPALFWMAAGATGMWFVSDKTESLVKWGVIGAGAYFAAKHFKVIN